MRKLAQAFRMLGDGKDVANVCRELQVGEQTYYRWRSRCGSFPTPPACFVVWMNELCRLAGFHRSTAADRMVEASAVFKSLFST